MAGPGVGRSALVYRLSPPSPTRSARQNPGRLLGLADYRGDLLDGRRNLVRTRLDRADGLNRALHRTRHVLRDARLFLDGGRGSGDVIADRVDRLADDAQRLDDIGGHVLHAL